MNKYNSDRKFSDRFIPEVKIRLASHVIKMASEEEDTKQATDLLSKEKRIAVRIRKHDVRANPEWRWQFTIRYERDTGTETEFSKVIKGCGDWLFYGHQKSESSQDLSTCWWLIDLDVLRHSLILEGMKELELSSGQIPNGDGTYFKYWDLRYGFPKEILIASGWIYPKIKIIKGHVTDENEDWFYTSIKEKTGYREAMYAKSRTDIEVLKNEYMLMRWPKETGKPNYED